MLRRRQLLARPFFAKEGALSHYKNAPAVRDRCSAQQQRASITAGEGAAPYLASCDTEELRGHHLHAQGASSIVSLHAHVPCKKSRDILAS